MMQLHEVLGPDFMRSKSATVTAAQEAAQATRAPAPFWLLARSKRQFTAHPLSAWAQVSGLFSASSCWKRCGWHAGGPATRGPWRSMQLSADAIYFANPAMCTVVALLLLTLASCVQLTKQREKDADVEVWAAFTDPSNNPGYPGWPLRNLLMLAAKRWGCQTLRVVGVRDSRGHMDTARSLHLMVQLPKLPQGQ